MARQRSMSAALGERDAARHIGYSVQYLRDARRNRRGPAYIRVGRSIRYLPRDLDAWLDAHRVDPAAADQDIRDSDTVAP